MTTYSFAIQDFYYIATGAAVLASGGGGSYQDALSIIDELSTQWQGRVTVQDYDGASSCCVLAMMGSPDKADNLTLRDVHNSITNTVQAYQNAVDEVLTCVIPVEIGPINSIVPLIAVTMPNNSISWVVNGDGAGRAVPELPQTTYTGNTQLAPSPCALANDAAPGDSIQSSVINAPTAAMVESIAGGILTGFGSFAGIAMWPSNSNNQYALQGSYIPNTLFQAWSLGQYLMSSTHSTAEVASFIQQLTGRSANVVVTNFYITAVIESTDSSSLDAGVIRLDNTPDQATSTETHYIYNLNENLIMYNRASTQPDIIAPDSICYYSESTGRGFSNASDDLAVYFDSSSGKSTGKTVSVIRVATAAQLYQTPGVVASFAGLLQNIGYAGSVPYQ